MNSLLEFIAEITEGTFYKSMKFCVDEEFKIPSVNYNEPTLKIIPNTYGETDTSLKTFKSLVNKSLEYKKYEPLFRYFLDGSRRIYKVDDIEYGKRIYPIIGGQIGVACCERLSPAQFKPAETILQYVLSLPTAANADNRTPELFFNSLTSKLNQLNQLKRFNIKFSKILTYESSANNSSEEKKYEDRAVARVQDEMIDCEKRTVANLASQNRLSYERYLLKDGSLQYKPMKTGDFKELAKIKNNYRWVVGASKSFNPELAKDRNNKGYAPEIAKLPLYSRTPVMMYENQTFLGNVKFGIWYIRIRKAQYSESLFSGVLKLEKILVTEEEQEYGLDSSEVDSISANIINERNPVCYGKDQRWANHLYPIFLTESYLKSKYLSDLHFLNLF